MITLGGGALRLWPRALSEEKTAQLLVAMPLLKTGSAISHDAVLARLYVEHLRTIEGFPTFIFTAPAKLTYTRSQRPIPWHYDAPHGETHKVLVYLNAIKHGGTVFEMPEGKVLVPGDMGSVLLFDMKLHHASENFVPPGATAPKAPGKITKCALGMRITPLEGQG